MLFICVGSTNPVKIKAVEKAVEEKLPGTSVQGFEVESGVKAQPITDDETRRGAENRARMALVQGAVALNSKDGHKPEVLGVGLEGGIFQNEAGEVWSTVWAVVVDQKGQLYQANGGRIKVPTIIAAPLFKGKEMGPVVDSLIGGDVRQKQGMFGVITNNMVTRTEEYSSVAKMALGIWYGRAWDEALVTKA